MFVEAISVSPPRWCAGQWAITAERAIQQDGYFNRHGLWLKRRLLRAFPRSAIEPVPRSRQILVDFGGDTWPHMPRRPEQILAYLKRYVPAQESRITFEGTGHILCVGLGNLPFIAEDIFELRVNPDIRRFRFSNLQHVNLELREGTPQVRAGVQAFIRWLLH